MEIFLRDYPEILQQYPTEKSIEELLTLLCQLELKFFIAGVYTYEIRPISFDMAFPIWMGFFLLLKRSCNIAYSSIPQSCLSTRFYHLETWRVTCITHWKQKDQMVIPRLLNNELRGP